MDDEKLRIGIGLRLGCPLRLPHICAHCGEHVDQGATHGLSCKWSQGRHSRHGEINDIIHWSLFSGKIASKLEPTGLSRDDGKRPDGMSIIPWLSGRLLVMQHAVTFLPLLTSTLLYVSQRLWLSRRRGRKFQSTAAWIHPTN